MVYLTVKTIWDIDTDDIAQWIFMEYGIKVSGLTYADLYDAFVNNRSICDELKTINFNKFHMSFNLPPLNDNGFYIVDLKKLTKTKPTYEALEDYLTDNYDYCYSSLVIIDTFEISKVRKTV